MAEENNGLMPVGSTTTLPLRESDVELSEGNKKAPEWKNDDAVCTLVWENYNTARSYIENNAWLLEWQEADILMQSPIPNRFVRAEQGRPARVPRFILAKAVRTMARAMKRGLFAEQYPFFLRPTGKTTTPQIDAWSALIGKLLKRMKFTYYSGLLVNCQTLQGTTIAKLGWEEREVVKKRRKRKGQPITAEMPKGPAATVPTAEGDAFQTVSETVKESWPFIEYRRLGTSLFDPKWSTPDQPDESAGYVIDIDYVFLADLQEMRQLKCYKNIPDDETLKTFFFQRPEQSAPVGSQVEDSMSSQGSMVVHAEARNRATTIDPTQAPLLLLEQWDQRTVKTVLIYDGRKLCIRNEEHGLGSMMHPTATWWPIDNSGYGFGLGRTVGSDQRIAQGVLNEALKMIAYPMNAPLLVDRGVNAPTQNVIARLGGFWQLDVPPGGDVNKAAGFMKMPEVPGDAWRIIQLAQEEAEHISGADQAFQQGSLPGPRSSTTRTAAGVNRVSAMSDQSVADPIDSFAGGIIIPTIEFLVKMVKERMPLSEIRDILSEKHAAVIAAAIDEDTFIDATFEVDVLAGQKLAARAGIQQLIPFFLQLAQQPQLLEYLHQRGETIDFAVIEDLLMQVSELTQQPDIFRKLTPQELQMIHMMNPGAQKAQQALAVEQARGQNRQKEIASKGQVDLALKAAQIALEHTEAGIPLTRAAGLLERASDKDILAGGLPDAMQQ